MHNSIHYQPLLVLLSYAISVFGSYTALQLAIGIPQARDRKAMLTAVAGAAVALGGGAIWSMHFIAMTAADMGMPVAYDAVLTYASLLIAIAASGTGLALFGRSGGDPLWLALGGLATGLGVAVMHYMGMEAMVMPMKFSYDPVLVLLSLVIGVTAATVALWLAFNLRGNMARFISAFVMGVAVCGMHYTGMFAVKMTHEHAAASTGGMSVSATGLAITVAGITAVVLTLLLGYSTWKSRRAVAA
jgi:NO-binding membrane sensor protein with MHYT domain